MVELASSMPAMDDSMWRSANNHCMLEFTGHVNPPAAGALMIQELLDDGAYGPDLSADFSFLVDGTTVGVDEQGAMMEHAKWYAIRNTGDWAGVAPFEVHMVMVVGDANGDGRVLPNDLSLINTDIPNFNASVDSRLDVTGEGMVLPNDLSVTNAHIPTFNVPKPSGH